MLVRYILYTALLYGAVLSQLSAMPAYAAELTRMPALPVPRGGGSSRVARPVDSEPRRRRHAPSRCNSAEPSTASGSI
jgi:hypothetical protein